MLQDLNRAARTTKGPRREAGAVRVCSSARRCRGVLAEISFVTNKTDALQLKQNAFRQAIAQRCSTPS